MLQNNDIVVVLLGMPKIFAYAHWKIMLQMFRRFAAWLLARQVARIPYAHCTGGGLLYRDRPMVQ